MLFETRYYYSRTPNSYSFLDKEMSTPVREITAEQAETFMNLFGTILGLKRRETEKEIFFTKVIDCCHSEEYIFYK